MKVRRHLMRVAAFTVLLVMTSAASAAIVLQMGLSDLVNNADRIYRGTVVSKEPGMVSRGGHQLPVVNYEIRVDDALKGDFASDKEANVVTLTMLGNLKASGREVNGQQHLVNLDVNPELAVGSDYVLFTTAPSRLGLSTTVGLGQGLFRVVNNASGRAMAVNGFNNQSLFDGPVSYEELKAAVAGELN